MGILGKAFNGGLLGMGGLSGMGGPSLPEGLLSAGVSKKDLNKMMMKQAMLNAGLALLGQGPSDTPIDFGQTLATGMQGGLLGAANARQQFMDNALLSQELADKKAARDASAKDQAWQNTQRARQMEDWQREDDARAAQKNYVTGMLQQPTTAYPTWQTGQARAFAGMGDYGSAAKALVPMPPAQTERDKPTAEMQNYQYAISQLRSRGVPDDKLPTFQEWSKPKSRGIVFTGPDGTQVQIGGNDGFSGLDGTSIPAEVGARIGLGAEFLRNDYEQIKQQIASGEATGPIDYASGMFGRGAAGNVQRRMASGVDALRRGLTGAGMSMAEADDYARRYLPQMTDDADTLMAKLENLKTDLEAVASGAVRGKAGQVSGFVTDPQPQGDSVIINGYSIKRVK